MKAPFLQINLSPLEHKRGHSVPYLNYPVGYNSDPTQVWRLLGVSSGQTGNNFFIVPAGKMILKNI